MRVFYILLFTILAFVPASLLAQDPMFDIPEVTGDCDDMIDVPVTIESDFGLINIAFSVGWNPAVLQYEGVAEQPAQYGGTVTFTQGSTGLSSIGYSYSNINENMFSAGDVLITLRFTVIGGDGSPSPIIFTTSPTDYEIADGNFTIYDFNGDNGSITASDTEAPTIMNCADVSFTATGCDAVVNFADPDVMDDCDPNPSISYSPLGPGSTFPVGTTAVTATVTDNSGQTANCTFNVTVNSSGNGAPVISDCPGATITATALPGQTSATVSNIGITATDCETVSFSYVLNGTTSGSGNTNDASGEFNLGTTTVTYTATDGTNSSTCTFDVVVSEQMVGGGDLNLFLVANSPTDCDNEDFYVDVFANNFTDITSVQFTVQWDNTFMQYEGDVEMIGLPSNPDFSTDAANLTQATQLRAAWSNASGFSAGSDPFLLFRIPFTLVAQGGSTSTIDFFDGPPTPTQASDGSFSVITVNTSGTSISINADNEPPMLDNCPGPIITVTAPQGANGMMVTGLDASASDNCDNVDISYVRQGPVNDSGMGTANGLFFPIGTTNVTYTFTDGTNSVTCEFQVVVNPGNPDAIILSFSNPGDIDCNQSTVSIDVNVENFVNLVSLSFSINWPESILSLNPPISNVALENLVIFGPSDNPSELGAPLTYLYSDGAGFNSLHSTGICFDKHFFGF